MIYQALSDIFQHYESDLSVAEAHGIATAMLCVKGHTDAINWLKEIFDEDLLIIEEHKILLAELFEQTRTLLNPDQSTFEFDLLLPETQTLSQQAIALISWCQGFLSGIGFTRSSVDRRGEINSILADMVEFTKLDYEDDNEMAFMQIHQYLRAAVLIVRDEFNPTQS
jgi:uncharacterized protein YgfB (UPF0149 family)